MKKWLNDEASYKKFITHVVTGLILIAFYFFLANFESVRNFLGKLISVLSPFIWGAALAFILLKLEAKIEKLFKFKKQQVSRVLASILSVLIVVIILVLFFIILIPQLGESISQLAVIVTEFTSNASYWLSDLSANSILPDSVISDLYSYSSSIVSTLWEFAKTSIPNIVNFTMNTFSAVLNFVIGFIVAIYILIDRDNLTNSIKRFFKAFFSNRTYSRFGKVVRLSYDKFTSFLVGKVIDSAIIGVLCFILMSILGLDFSVLISLIVGVTNIIPFFGPLLGAIPSALILLIVAPKQALIFVIMVFALQQVDGNIIGPRILGDSVGLSSLWIMFAIIVGGGYFGFMGMLLGVPVFAIIYFSIKEYVDEKLKDNKEVV